MQQLCKHFLQDSLLLSPSYLSLTAFTVNILCAEFKTVTVSHCSQRRGAFRQNYFEAQVQKELHKHLYLVLFSFLPKDSVHEVIKTDSCAIISIDNPQLRVEAFLFHWGSQRPAIHPAGRDQKEQLCWSDQQGAELCLCVKSTQLQQCWFYEAISVRAWVKKIQKNLSEYIHTHAFPPF